MRRSCCLVCFFLLLCWLVGLLVRCFAVFWVVDDDEYDDDNGDDASDGEGDGHCPADDDE